MSVTKDCLPIQSNESDINAAVDSWYAEAIADGRNRNIACGVPTAGVYSIDQLIDDRFPRLSRLARKSSSVRGVLWFLSSRNARRVACTFSSSGLLSFLALESVFHRGNPRVFLLEFLRPQPEGLKATLKEALHTWIFKFLFSHTIAGIQVMTDWEIDHYSRKYRLSPRLFSHISFPMMLQPSKLPEFHGAPRRTVLASGRAACDWETLFAAARDADWHLTIVCSSEDRAAVESLNRDGRATVMSEISADEHDRLLRNAGVYALVLREQGASSGHVRFARAIEAGIPVVATRVRGLDGYLENGVTGMAVPVGDDVALRETIDKLLAHQKSYQELRLRAYEAMRPRTLENYVSLIKSFLLQTQSKAG